MLIFEINNSFRHVYGPLIMDMCVESTFDGQCGAVGHLQFLSLYPIVMFSCL